MWLSGVRDLTCIVYTIVLHTLFHHRVASSSPTFPSLLLILDPHIPIFPKLHRIPIGVVVEATHHVQSREQDGTGRR